MRGRRVELAVSAVVATDAQARERVGVGDARAAVLTRRVDTRRARCEHYTTHFSYSISFEGILLNVLFLYTHACMHIHEYKHMCVHTFTHT